MIHVYHKPIHQTLPFEPSETDRSPQMKLRRAAVYRSPTIAKTILQDYDDSSPRASQESKSSPANFNRQSLNTCTPYLFNSQSKPYDALCACLQGFHKRDLTSDDNVAHIPYSLRLIIVALLVSLFITSCSYFLGCISI